MRGQVASRLQAKGLVLPPAPVPVATYVGFVTVGKLVHVAGVGPTWARTSGMPERLAAISALSRVTPRLS